MYIKYTNVSDIYLKCTLKRSYVSNTSICLK